MLKQAGVHEKNPNLDIREYINDMRTVWRQRIWSFRGRERLRCPSWKQAGQPLY
jgi:hypothetical protein